MVFLKIIFIYSQAILMPKIKLLLCLVLLLSQALSLSITSVSLQNPALNSNLQGSIMGGTKLYIEGLGFSSTMKDNIITVGDFPCLMEDGATATSIVCRTTRDDNIGIYKNYWSLSIVVYV